MDNRAVDRFTWSEMVWPAERGSGLLPSRSRLSRYGVSGLRRIFGELYDGLVVAALDE
jgi:hypothetical protein